MCNFCYWDDALDTAEEIITEAEEVIDVDGQLLLMIEKAESLYEMIEEKEHVTNEERNVLELMREKVEAIID